ncbi:FeoA family protein [Stieleria tagensis]|uniref:FeoA family protein n=1 Tax=Stieleria tagensis TaxID=2956795 RepID=UPI00209B4F02|nr:FeoA family protein [Stieleria tagensis]
MVQAPSLTLADANAGRFRCEQVLAAGLDAVRLKRLGICAGRELELIGRGDPMVVRIGESRIGLSRQLASLVTVEIQVP